MEDIHRFQREKCRREGRKDIAFAVFALALPVIFFIAADSGYFNTEASQELRWYNTVYVATPLIIISGLVAFACLNSAWLSYREARSYGQPQVIK